MLETDLLRVQGAEQLRRLAKDLRKHEEGREIRKGVVRSLKDVANEVVRAEKAAVLALPSKGENARRGRRSLRRRFATATQSRVRASGKDAGVSVLINPKRMPEGQQNLPAYWNRERGYERLRHPVFGDPDTWVQDQHVTPWFYETARPYETVTQRRLIGVLDAAARDLERG